MFTSKEIIKSVTNITHNVKDGICTAYIRHEDAVDIILRDFCNGNSARQNGIVQAIIRDKINSTFKGSVLAFAKCAKDAEGNFIDEYDETIGATIAMERIVNAFKVEEIKVFKKLIESEINTAGRDMERLSALQTYKRMLYENRHQILHQVFPNEPDYFSEEITVVEE